MRLVLVCPVYPPEVMPSGIMLSELAQHFSEKGDGVTVYTTFPSLPEGKVFSGYRRRFWQVDRNSEVQVVRCFSFTVGTRRKPLWRVLSHVSFGLTAGLRLLFEKDTDIVVMDVFPVLTAPFILLAGLIRKFPVMNRIQDLYPEAAEAARIIRPGGALARIAKQVDRWVCRKSTAILVIAEGFETVLSHSRGVPQTQFEVIYNWIDGSQILPLDRVNSWRQEQKIPSGTFVAMFAGTLGLASGADVIVDAALELRRRNQANILIVCIGEGLLKAGMVEKAKSLKLDNIWFLPFQPTEQLAQVQSAADVMLLTMSERHVFSSVPSKLITYMAVGRPVLCSADPASTVAKLVANAGIGLVIQPGNPVALAEALIEMRTRQSEWAQRGRKARDYFERNFDMPVALEKFEHLLKTLVNGNLPATR